MAKYSDIRDAIKTQLESISNIGNVHAYERWSHQRDDFLSHYKASISGSDVIRGWTIMRESMPTEFGDLAGPNVSLNEEINVVIRGYMGLSDGGNTQDTFDDLLDLVIDELNAQPTLHADVRRVGPCNLRSEEWRTFGSRLCHYCEIEVPILLEVDVTRG